MVFQYDSAGQLARLAAPGFDLAIARNLDRRLTWFRLGKMSLGVEFIPATKTLRISTEHEQHPAQWQFGPKNRAVGFRNAEKAIWWVWGVDGRVIQMAQGVAENNADGGDAVRITGTIGVQ